jgi:ATP-binding cassette subfamily B protein
MGALVAAREFRVADEYTYDRRTAVRWIASHVLRYPWLIGGFALATACLTGMASMVPVLTGRTFDAVLHGADGRQILLLTLAVFGVRTAQALFALVNNFGAETLAQRVQRDARDELYVSLLGKSQTFHNRQRVGDVMARATNDVQQLGPMINPGMRLMSNAILNVVMPLIAISTINPQLLLVPVLFLVSFVIALWRFNRELRPVAGAQRAQFGLLNASLAERISGIEVVKGNAQEPREEARFRANARAYRDAFVRQGHVEARYLPVLIFGIGLGLAFGHGMLLYLNGAATVGQVVSFIGLYYVVREPSYFSLYTFELMQLGTASGNRVLELLRAETELDENRGGVTQPIRGEIAFEHVTFGYGPEPILHDVSFHANPGETVAIVGQTGSGKSTLTQLVQRIYDVQEGRVLVDGVDVREWSMESLRSQIAAIEQDVFLFSRTIRENIAFGAGGRATQEQVEAAARAAQAHDFIARLPNGYETVVGERGFTLSGGQRQRIAIARAFLTDPRILILDDSTSAIDSATEDQIQRALRGILQGRTTHLITHRIAQIRWADRILVMRRGQLVAQGTHEELIATSDAYRRIFAHGEPTDAPPEVAHAR